jgi:hypothetical protein
LASPQPSASCVPGTVTTGHDARKKADYQLTLTT